MWKQRIIGAIFSLFLAYGVSLFTIPRTDAGVPCTVPFNLLNGTVADATQVMANYNAIITCLGSAAASGVNSDITSLTTVAGGAATLWGNPTSASSTNRSFTIASLPTLASPSATLDLVPCWEHTTGQLNKCTPGAIAGTNTAGVASLGGATGIVTLGTSFSIPGNVLTLGNIPVSQGGTGATGMFSTLSGMMPFKDFTTGKRVGINQGSFADSQGAAFYNQTNTLEVDLNALNILPTGGSGSTCLGGQISGALGNSSAYDMVQVNFFMVKRNSDNLLCLVTSSADLYQSDVVVTFTGGGSSNFTFGACIPAGGCGFTPNQTVYFTNVGGSLPTLVGGGSLGANQFYYITNTQQHSGTTLQISPAPNQGSLQFSSSGSGTTTMHIGVQNELNLVMGVGNYSVLRWLGHSVMWHWTKFAGVPEFQPLGPDMPVMRLTSAEQSAAYQVLSGGTAAGFGSPPIDLRPWLPNASRNVTLLFRCTATGGPGTVYVAVAAATGLPVCEGLLGEEHYAIINIPTNSDTQVGYRVIGGAIADAWIISYQFVSPH